MSKSKKSSQNLFEVTSPCSQNWEAMRGSDKVRFCEHCALEVNNLSAMRRKDAMRLARESKGRICVRYVKNPQTNAPIFAGKFHQIAPRLAIGAMTAALGFSSITYAQSDVSLTPVADEQIAVSRDKNSVKDKIESPPTSISGTITDPNGAVIPGIAVSLIAANDAVVGKTTSNDEGFYQFQNFAAGTYKLKAEASFGFASFQVDEIIVSAGNELKTDVTMQPGGESVTVGELVAIGYELPLLQAVSEQNTDEIKSLLASGADVNGRDKNYGGITAMFVAVENGNVETVRTLLDFGAKINARDDEKRTPLMRLDDDATTELVKLLITYGAKIKAVDREGNTVLHHAAFSVNSEVLQILISEGAKIDAQNKDGQTALMIAANYENVESIKALINAGANVNLRDREDRTALGIALENDYREIADLLIACGAKE